MKAPARRKAKPAAPRPASTSYAAERYAHPFFVPASPADRQPVNGHKRMTDWSKLQLGPVPSRSGNAVVKLAELIGATGVKEIEDLGEIRFHALGDTGVGHADEAQKVAEDMAVDYKPDAGALNPAFLLHLGDVIYGNDKSNHFGERFYSPYRRYPGKIIAIPGNHDGEVRAPVDSPSLKAFRANFCASSAVVPPQASSTGIYRKTMTLPGVYWLLDAPFVRIIGLYSNLLENPGYLHGKTASGKLDMTQLEWFKDTLSGLANKEQKALVIATHHPPYSSQGHSGSTEMNASIDEACASANVVPHAVLSAHAHNYQRYTRRIAGKQVLYIVAGTGGMPPQNVPAATGQPADSSNQVTYDGALAAYGYLFGSATKHQLKFDFWQLGAEHTTAYDPITLDLATHVVI
jgi:hypothetical protein